MIKLVAPYIPAMIFQVYLQVVTNNICIHTCQPDHQAAVLSTAPRITGILESHCLSLHQRYRRTRCVEWLIKSINNSHRSCYAYIYVRKVLCVTHVFSTFCFVGIHQSERTPWPKPVGRFDKYALRRSTGRGPRAQAMILECSSPPPSHVPSLLWSDATVFFL